MKIKTTYKLNDKEYNQEFIGETQEQCKEKEYLFFQNKKYELVERRWLN